MEFILIAQLVERSLSVIYCVSETTKPNCLTTAHAVPSPSCCIEDSLIEVTNIGRGRLTV
jgi:hypothetical protein